MLVQALIQRAQVCISVHVDVHAVSVKLLVFDPRVRRLERHKRKKAQHRGDDEDKHLFENICRGIGAFRTVRAEQFENTPRREQPAVPFCRALYKIGNATGGLLFFALPLGAAENDLLLALIVQNGDVPARLYVDAAVVVEYLNGILFFGLSAVEFDAQRALFDFARGLFVYIDIVVFGIVLKHFAEVGILVQPAVHELYVAVGILFDERYLVRHHHDELGLGDLF